jgi:hypothetical protein
MFATTLTPYSTRRARALPRLLAIALALAASVAIGLAPHPDPDRGSSPTQAGAGTAEAGTSVVYSPLPGNGREG